MIEKVLRWGITLIGAVTGLALTDYLIPFATFILGTSAMKFAGTKIVFAVLVGILTGGVIGFFVAPRLLKIIESFIKWSIAKLLSIPLIEVLTGAVGLVFGLIIANLFSLSLVSIPVIGEYIAMTSNIVFGLIAMIFAVKKRIEIIALFSKKQNTIKECLNVISENQLDIATPKIVDTSAIIDGRILDVCRTGFLEGPLLISYAVLEELQHIADSSDALKRNRGRRGLDVLQSMQSDKNIKVIIDEAKFNDVPEVDSKLIKLAKKRKGKIITVDYNLNKVAELQKVSVLNVNELTNAVKSVLLAGEEMEVAVLKEGKEAGQGVAYMDDGTMVVVEKGAKSVGKNVRVQITSVLQTNAGKIIFTKIV